MKKFICFKKNDKREILPSKVNSQIQYILIGKLTTESNFTSYWDINIRNHDVLLNSPSKVQIYIIYRRNLP